MVSEFHEKGYVPVFNLVDGYQGLLRQLLPGFAENPIAAFQHFGEATGLRVEIVENGTKFQIWPTECPDPGEWKVADVPFYWAN